MDVISWVVLVLSLALFGQALFSLYLMLYTWGRPDRLEASSGPSSFREPVLSFAVLLPARHEEAVIYRTIKRVWAANYPKDLLEIVVVCSGDDEGTIAEARRAVREIGSPCVRVETFSGKPINKPRGLNVGFGRTSNEIVTIFDAEDDIDPDVFDVINTVMLEEDDIGVVQSGVQLMNFRDRWFGAHNCLEYFFWFKSRLHFHAKVGMIPLGGNTVFMRRDLIERVGGWDEGCLTEDADIGLRMSALGEKIRVVYDARHVTREETPDTVGSFVKQRTRWHQGFLQILRKGSWLKLPRVGQKLLAFYTLSYTVFQGLVTILWPLALAAVFFVEVPVGVALVSFLPLYALVGQLLINVAGAHVFAKEYGLKRPFWMPLAMAVTFVPFQLLLGLSALRALYREARRQKGWEKTEHKGAHRRPEVSAPNEYELLLDEAMSHLDAERGSVMVLDAGRNDLSIEASRGLPDEIAGSARARMGEGVAGWVAQKSQPLILGSGAAAPDELSPRLTRSELRSSIVMPIVQDGGDTVAVLSLSSRDPDLLGRDEMNWVQQRLGKAMFLAPAAGNPATTPADPTTIPHRPEGADVANRRPEHPTTRGRRVVAEGEPGSGAPTHARDGEREDERRRQRGGRLILFLLAVLACGWASQAWLGGAEVQSEVAYVPQAPAGERRPAGEPDARPVRAEAPPKTPAKAAAGGREEQRGPAPAATTSDPREHEVSEGESVASIADAYYGDTELWPLIWDSNKGRLGLTEAQMESPDHIEPGWVLVIPEGPGDSEGRQG